MKKIRKAFAIVFAFAMSILGTVTAFATTPTTIDTADIMSTTMTSLVNQIMGVIAVVVPIAMTLVGAVIAIKFGIRFIKGLVGR